MLKKVIGILLGVLLLTGCGANIRQEGNKIYTDLSKDKVYGFATTAVQSKGYTITKEDAASYTFTAVPENNRTLGSADTEDKSVVATITDGSGTNETVVTVLAQINGNVDQESSEQIAGDAVAEIIAELNKYGKFTSQRTAEHVYAIATAERVSDFIEDYLVLNSLVYEKTSSGFSIKDAQANNQFNEPLVARIAIAADETNRVTLRLGAVLQGNYDVDGNQVYVDNFISRLVDYLDTYPVVEKGTRHTYRFIDFARAFTNAKATLTSAGFTLQSEDKTNYVLTAAKGGLNLAVTFTKINTSIAVNIEAFIEAAAGETKEQLNEEVTEELFSLAQLLAAQQTILTSDKAFLSSNQNDVVKSVRSALADIGYTYTFDAAEFTFDAVDKTDPQKAHYLLVNNLGAEGIVVQINTLYNAKAANAEATVRAENNKLLRALGNYDTLK
ncbi:MAG: hypothetical protein LBQ83_01560 [Candidatus Margulisbacteria bacterium]|jgi:hypothetical protein|nr:hypothetical protein [Candidatus Margulisiibacteriota bacterium]